MNRNSPRPRPSAHVMPNAFIAAIIRIGKEHGIKVSELMPERRRFLPVETTPNICYNGAVAHNKLARKMYRRSKGEAHMNLDWSFGDHNARVQEGARNATLVDQTGAWHLRIKYDPPIIAGEHWDVLIAWKRQYTPSFTEAIIKSSDILKQEWEITV
jgi:hypothetical protein